MRDRDERMRVMDADMEAAKKKNTQQAADLQQAESANIPKWPPDHMSRFLSAQVECNQELSQFYQADSVRRANTNSFIINSSSSKITWRD